MDYQPINASYTIPTGSTEHFVHLRIENDSNAENPESLQITLGSPSVDATIMDAISTVNIIDQQGML